MQTPKIVLARVTMTFTDNGQLIYDIDAANKLQRMNLIYRVSGDTIISDQPSHPQEQRTKFSIENGNKLIMEFAGERTIFSRSTK